MSLNDIVNKNKDGTYTLKTTLSFYSAVKGYEIFTPMVRLQRDGFVIIESGFTWDGATGAPDLDCVLIPSALHDAFYRFIREKLLPKKIKAAADRSFYEAIKNNVYGRPLSNIESIKQRAIADIYYTGVRWFGFIGLK